MMYIISLMLIIMMLGLTYFIRNIIRLELKDLDANNKVPYVSIPLLVGFLLTVIISSISTILNILQIGH